VTTCFEVGDLKAKKLRPVPVTKDIVQIFHPVAQRDSVIRLKNWQRVRHVIA